MITSRSLLIGLAALALPLFSGSAAVAQERKSSDLQFNDIGRVPIWRPAGPRLIYIKDAKEQWYKIELLEPCMDLFPGKDPTFITLTDTAGQRYSAVVIERHQCTVTDLAKLPAAPPRIAYVPGAKPDAPAKPAKKPAPKTADTKTAPAKAQAPQSGCLSKISGRRC